MFILLSLLYAVGPCYYVPGKYDFLVITIKMSGFVKTPIQLMYFFRDNIPVKYVFPGFDVVYS